MVGFWVFMLIMNLLIPLSMITIGICYSKKPPKEINDFSGYRTTRSKKNKDTWEFAHHYCGKLFKNIGLIIAPLTLIAMFFLFGKDINCIGIYGMIIAVIQLLITLSSMIPVEAALKRNFDENGQRKLY